MIHGRINPQISRTPNTASFMHGLTVPGKQRLRVPVVALDQCWFWKIRDKRRYALPYFNLAIAGPDCHNVSRSGSRI
jgi:hypothetical protein